MEVLRKRIRIHKNELLEALEIRDGDKLKFYSYTYKGYSEKGFWKPYIRWDNWEQKSHVDKFDEMGNLIEQKNCRDKNLDEILKLVSIFRKNLMTMDLSEV